MFSDLTIKKILKDAKLLKPAQLKELAAAAAKAGIPIEKQALSTKAVTEDLLYREAARILKTPFVDIQNAMLRKDILFLVPEPFAISHHLLAFEKDASAIHLATTDPTDIQAIEFVSRKTGLKPKVFLTTPKALDEALKNYHRNISAEFENLTKTKGEKGEMDAKALKTLAEDLPVVRIVDSILDHAAYEGASDIHVEPTETELIVRYRIDGVLRNVMNLPKIVADGVVARVKILSNLKLDEHRLPQDGRFKIQSPDHRFSIRVSIIPVFDGEKIVMRLLPETAQALTLEQLGLQTKARAAVERAIKRPHGIIYATGPTGSGKTTTLYSLLGILNKPGVNIVTVEDPIEYRMPGVNQSQMNDRIGYTFANALRALLRQDPNIMMVGEIRDGETASIAANAAMTGHLVLTTLHTNDAPTAIPRLMDMDVPPFLVAFTTNVIVAQRLVRKVCSDCITSHAITDAEIAELQSMVDVPVMLEHLKKAGELGKTAGLKGMTLYRGVGCARCGHEGYKGRIGIYEVLELTPTLADLVAKRASVDEIRKRAISEGMITMLEDGFLKAKRGITTITEILRVTKE